MAWEHAGIMWRGEEEGGREKGDNKNRKEAGDIKKGKKKVFHSLMNDKDRKGD